VGFLEEGGFPVRPRSLASMTHLARRVAAACTGTANPDARSRRPDRLVGMNLYREQAVVLRTWKLGEADRIVVLMTQGQGKVRAVAKGVRKTKSRFGGRLEPFSHVDLSLYRGRELDIVTQAEVVAPFRTLREDYDRVVAGTAILEAVDQVAQEREAAVRIYLLLVRALRALDGAPRDPSVVLDAFLLKLMALEGYRPALAECAGCGRQAPLRCFSIVRGGGLCDHCRSGEESTLDGATMPLLAALLGNDLDTTAAAVPAPGSRREAGALVKGYVEYHLERRLRAYPLVAR
jgi:DNA repair protein RecO (recombination protein O)